MTSTLATNEAFLDVNAQAARNKVKSISDLAEIAVVDQMPKLEGRQMVMVFAPKKK